MDAIDGFFIFYGTISVILAFAVIGFVTVVSTIVGAIL
jgi:hypothetical protein